ncbi:MAG: AI-2E family transporter YdiK [Gemmatimonadota bacterium]
MPIREPVAPPDFMRLLLVATAVTLLAAATFWVLRPFLPSILWAAMIVVATWPLMRLVEARTGQRRWIAIVAMTLLLLLVFAIPLFLAVATIVDNADRLVDGAKLVAERGLPMPPPWVERIPLAGTPLAQAWRELAVGGSDGIIARLAPHVGELVRWFAGLAGNVGLTALQFLLTLAIAAVMYASGEAAAQLVVRFARRLAGERGDQVITLAGQAIRGVAFGVVGTALAQTALAGLGLALSGVPFAGLLTAIAFILCIAQIGALPILLPAAAWAFWQDAVGWGVFLVVWSVVVASMDNVLRPWLIQRGANLPLLLIFAGVIGGLLAFGLVGLFLGPVVLAVTYKLLTAWIEEEPARSQ